MKRLKELEKAVLTDQDKQISRTNSDARPIQNGRKGMLAGYNVQTLIATQYKLIVAHDVTTAQTGIQAYRHRLSPTAKLVQDALKLKEQTVLANRGYYSGAEIRKCYESGVNALMPKN